MVLVVITKYQEFMRDYYPIVRGMAHPMLFGSKYETSRQESSRLDTVSMYGGLPVTPINMYRLFERNQYVLLYPGGAREALHRKVSLKFKFCCTKIAFSIVCYAYFVVRGRVRHTNCFGQINQNL